MLAGRHVTNGATPGTVTGATLRARLRAADQRLGTRVTLGLVALASAGYFLFVIRFGVNVPFEDEWHMVLLLAKVHHGQLSLPILWAQHNENRMFFAYLLMLVLDRASGFNTKVEMYASAVLLLAAVVVLLQLWRDDRWGSLLWAAPAIVVLLSLAQYAVALQGFALAIYIILVCLPLALWALKLSERGNWWLCLALLLGLIASYSSLQGLALWPAGVVYLVARGRSPKVVAAWSAGGVLTAGIYLIGLNFTQAGGGGVGAVLAAPLAAAHYLALLVGSVIPTDNFLHLGLRWLSLLGVLLLLAALAIFVYWLRSSAASELALPVAVIGFAVTVDVLNTLGRAQYGVSYATSPRYVVFNLWLLAGIWLAVVRIRSHLGAPRLRPVEAAMAAIGVVVLAQVCTSVPAAIGAAHQLHAQRQQAIALVRDYQVAKPALVVRYLYPSVQVFEIRAAELRQMHLSVFASRH